MVRNKLLFLVLVFLALQLLLIHRAQAEYRVYRLGVKATPQATEQEVLTTLDDLQYVTYYKMTPTQQTRIIEHWMCRGRTNDFTKYCSKPSNNAAPQPAIPLAKTQPAPAQSRVSTRTLANAPQQQIPVVVQ